MRAGLISATSYQETLSAAAEDRLDSFGNVVIEPSRVKRLKEEKRKKYSRLGSTGKTPFAKIHENLVGGSRASVAEAVGRRACPLV